MSTATIEHSLAAAAESGAFASVVPFVAGRDRAVRQKQAGRVLSLARPHRLV